MPSKKKKPALHDIARDEEPLQQYIEQPVGDWPDETTIHRQHRIAFYGKLGFKLDPSSSVSFQQQILQQEQEVELGRTVLTWHRYDRIMFVHDGAKKGTTMSKLQESYPDEKHYNNWYREKDEFQLSPNGQWLEKQVKRSRKVNGVKQTEVKACRILHSLNLFDEMTTAHYDLNSHKSNDKLYSRYYQEGYDIPMEIVTFFKQTCPVCCAKRQKAQSVPMKGAVRPIISHRFRERMQVDLISMDGYRPVQKSAEGVEKRYILVCKDHFTKFIYADAISNRTAAVVAESLVRHFTSVGYPLILHTDNGAEFIGTALIDCIKELYPNCVMVRGRPRMPQDQGSVEVGNRDVKKDLLEMQHTRRIMGKPYENWLGHQLAWIRRFGRHPKPLSLRRLLQIPLETRQCNWMRRKPRSRLQLWRLQNQLPWGRRYERHPKPLSRGRWLRLLLRRPLETRQCNGIWFP